MKEDEFLRDYYQQPEQKFRQQLRQQLLPAKPKRRQIMLPSLPSNTAVSRRLAFALIACMLIGAALFLPIGRTTLAQSIEQWFANLPFREANSLPQATGGGLGIKQVPQQHRESIHAAQDLIPFVLPTWVPESFTMSDVTVSDFGANTVTVADDFTEITVVWQQADAQFSLTVLDREIPILVEETDAVTELSLAGTPVAIHHGLWDESTNSYVMPSFITLSWEREGVYYHLGGYDSAISEPDLIHVATSLLEITSP